MIVRFAAFAALVPFAVHSPCYAARSGSHQFSGVASYYDTHYQGRTASGVQYNPNSFTAAHKTLPFGTRLRVTDAASGRTVEVVVNDRGPFTRGRVIDPSLSAAKQLQMMERGLTHITASVVAP
jgi:rare lipoprotein A